MNRSRSLLNKYALMEKIDFGNEETRLDTRKRTSFSQLLSITTQNQVKTFSIYIFLNITQQLPM